MLVLSRHRRYGELQIMEFKQYCRPVDLSSERVTHMQTIVAAFRFQPRIRCNNRPCSILCSQPLCEKCSKYSHLEVEFSFRNPSHSTRLSLCMYCRKTCSKKRRPVIPLEPNSYISQNHISQSLKKRDTRFSNSTYQ